MKSTINHKFFAAPFLFTKNGRGFTLIETLIYIAVLVIIISTVSSLFLWTVHSGGKTKAMREVLDNAERAMKIMTCEIKKARSVYGPTTTSTQLSLETGDYLSEGEAASYIDLYLCGPGGDVLCFKKESQNPIPLTSNNVEVLNLQFNRIAATSTFPSIQINLKIGYKTLAEKPECQASFNTTSTASLRSY